MGEAFDKLKFNAKAYDALSRDIRSNDYQNIVTNKDLDNVAETLKQSIEGKLYKTSDIEDTIRRLKDRINKESFTFNDIKDTLKLIKIDRLSESASANPFAHLNGKPLIEKVTTIIGIIFQTIIQIADNFIVLLVSIFIVLNLFYRSNVESHILYPSDPNAFPYVYYDENSNAKQTFLTSCSETNTKDKEDVVFLDTPAFFKADGTYDSTKNICKINDPHRTQSSTQGCDDNKPNNDYGEFASKPIYENLNFFAKKFMESNSEKTTNDLNLYSMIFYVMLVSNINTYSSMQGIDAALSPIFKNSSSQVNGLQYLLFATFTFIFYKLFQTTKQNFANGFNKLFPKPETGTKIGNVDIMDGVVNMLSGIMSPFMLFFKLFFMIIYPIVLFHNTIAYMNYSSYAASFLVKICCYLGVVFTMMLLLTHVGLIVDSLNKNSSVTVDGIFSHIIQGFLNILKKGGSMLKGILPKTELESFEDENTCAKFTSKKKCKDRTRCKWEDDKCVMSGKLNKKNQKRESKEGMDGADNSTMSCDAPKLFDLSFIKTFFKSSLGFIMAPILVILFCIPNFTSISLTFGITKSITIDYFRYMAKIICSMANYKGLIRGLFYMLVLYEITYFMSKPMAMLTVGVIISFVGYDLYKDTMKNMFVQNKCPGFMPDTNANINTNHNNAELSDLILPNLNSNTNK